MATRTDNRKLALDKALQYMESRMLNPDEFMKLTINIFEFLTNKTKNNNGKQQVH